MAKMNEGICLHIYNPQWCFLNHINQCPSRCSKAISIISILFVKSSKSWKTNILIPWWPSWKSADAACSETRFSRNILEFKMAWGSDSLVWSWAVYSAQDCWSHCSLSKGTYWVASGYLKEICWPLYTEYTGPVVLQWLLSPAGSI